MQAYRVTLEIIPTEMHGYRSNIGTTCASKQSKQVSKGTLVSVFFMEISAGLDIVPHIYFLRQLEMF